MTLFAISGRPLASACLLSSSAWDSGSANWCWCIGYICRFPSPSPPNRFCTFNYFKEFLAAIRSICCYFAGSLDVIGIGLSCWWWNEPSGNAVSSPASSWRASGPRSICVCSFINVDAFRISPLYLGLVFASSSRILTGEGLEHWGEGLPPSAPPKSGLARPGLASLAAFWVDE